MTSTGGSMSNLPTCCTDLKIDVMDVMFPWRLDADGREFMVAHGLGELTLEERHALLATAQYLGEGVVQVQHRCAQLQDDGRCGIYAKRPAICRRFDCGTRSDCACQGSGLITEVILHD